MSKPQFTCVGQDEWSRALYKSRKTGRVYVEVDGKLYTQNEFGEPCDCIGSLSDVEIVKEEKDG